MSDEKAFTNGEDANNEKEAEIEPVLSVGYRADSGFVVTINGNQDPIIVAGVAWYLERMAVRGMTVLDMMAEQAAQKEGGTVFGPDGVTPIPLNRHQRRHPTSH